MGTVPREVGLYASSPASLVAALVLDQSPPMNRVRTNMENATTSPARESWIRSWEAPENRGQRLLDVQQPEPIGLG